ncbi:MAG: DNA polymerase III subunit gamma/tau [Atribacterota bacterium]|nr:DNA polymerase III subunit gamma/tau [Atribacterota bacterium]
MAQYQSIYRKWRPQSFEDIVGQNHITQTLKNAIKMNRIGHAYLFSGPRGVGKTTTARIFAKALNCQNGPTETPCNECSRCIRINQGQSMDVLEIDGASNRGIEEIRELRSKIGFAPAEGKYKIYIIDEVHMLTDPAFNALLKTLEEPPGQVLFIFATTAPYKVPNTILSRCQSFYFRRISIEEMMEKLKRITEEEKINIDSSSLRLIAEGATGSMRDAESILDQVIAYSENRVTPDEVRDILGLIPRETLFQMIETIINHDTEKGLKLVGELVKEGIELNKFVQDLLIYTHNVSLLKVLGKNNPYSSSYFEAVELEKIWELIEKTEEKTILNIIEELKIIEERIRFHHYPWILLELMVVKLTYNESKTAHQEIITNTPVRKKDISPEKKEKIPQLIKKEIEKEKEGDTVQDSKITAQDIATKVELEKLWPRVLARLKEEMIAIYTFLMEGNNIRLEDDRLIVSFSPDHGFPKENLEKKENRKKLEKVLKEETKNDIRLKCIIEGDIDRSSKVSDKKENNGKIEKQPSAIEAVVKEKKSDEDKKEEGLTEKDILDGALNLFGGDIREG